MILKTNTPPIITGVGSINLCSKPNINNKTNVDSNMLHYFLISSPNNDSILNINMYYSNEPFKVEINSGCINISGRNDNEILLGVVHLASLSETNYLVQCQIIQDTPKTQYREFMLDIARNIFSVDEIKKFIDEMFRNRLNILHLHFSDDQNYAIESKVHPELNTNGFLKQSEIKELVNYAKTRGIEIVPEFDMPGHLHHLLEINSKLRCNPKNGNSICFAKDHSYLFELIDEICSLFPSEYYHLGGDELGIRNQCHCSECQKLMEQKGFKSPKELAAVFINQVAEYLQIKKGKKVIAWNDALHYGRINEGVIIQKWNNYPNDKTCLERYQSGCLIIIGSSTDTYFDYPYSLIPLRKTYGYIPEINGYEIEKPFGQSSHLWTEVFSTEEELEKMAFPRLQAFGENAWLTPDRLEYELFCNNLEKELVKLKCRGIDYTDLSETDKFKFNKIVSFLRKKAQIENYTDFSTLALLKMISEYWFPRKYKGPILTRK